MELVLVRHAQPAWADTTGRSTNDPGLTDLGRRQADRLADWLADPEQPPFDALSASPARRVQETAAPLQAALGLTPETRPWLLEIGSPNDWEGQPEDEVVEILRQLRTRPREEWWEGAPGGETFEDFHARVTIGVDAYLAEHGAAEHPEDPDHLWHIPADGPRLLLVAHAGTNSVITSHLLGLEPQPWEWERFPCDHASVTVLRSRPIAGGAIWALEYFSDVSHLPRADVTA